MTVIRRRPLFLPTLLVPLALLVAIVLPPAIARANMAPPWQPGDPLGEPVAGLQSVAITHETLRLDLRPLVQGQPAVIVATYHLRNDGAPRRLDLQFVAAALSTDQSGGGPSDEVRLDGAPVPSAPVTMAHIPSTWRPPGWTPAIPGDEVTFNPAGLTYHVLQRGKALAFTLVLPGGDHTVEVRYRALASRYSAEEPTVYWQLGYILAPARQWAEFGGLDVAVQLPAAWLAASNPPLARNGDTLSASFASLPADALALTVRAPAPRSVPVPLYGWLAGILLAGAASLGARRLGGSSETRPWTLVLTLTAAAIWSGGLMLLARYDGQQRPAPAVLDLTPAAWIGGAVLAGTFGALAGRRLARRGRSVLRVLPLALLMGLAWLVTVIAARESSLLTPYVADHQLANTYAYGAGAVSLAAGLLALGAGVVLTTGAAIINRRRSERELARRAAPQHRETA